MPCRIVWPTFVHQPRPAQARYHFELCSNTCRVAPLQLSRWFEKRGAVVQLQAIVLKYFMPVLMLFCVPFEG